MTVLERVVAAFAGVQFKDRLPPKRLPEQLATAIENHLRAHQLDSQRAVVGLVVDRLREFRMALDVAEREFVRAPWKEPVWTTHLPEAWSGVRPELELLDERLNAWTASKAKPKRKAGRPDRFSLRFAVFDCLSGHGLQLQRGPKSVAPQVLAKVLEITDDLEGKPTKERSEFSGKQWKEWVTEYCDACELLQGYAESGVRRETVIPHLRRKPRKNAIVSSGT